MQTGECAPLTTRSIVEPARQALAEGQAGPFAHAVPYTGETDRLVEKLADLRPPTLAAMHGSSYTGDGAMALREFSQAMREVLAPG